MWPNSQETPDLFTFTGEILKWKLHFLRVVVEISTIVNFNWEISKNSEYGTQQKFDTWIFQI